MPLDERRVIVHGRISGQFGSPDAPANDKMRVTVLDSVPAIEYKKTIEVRVATFCIGPAEMFFPMSEWVFALTAPETAAKPAQRGKKAAAGEYFLLCPSSAVPVRDRIVDPDRDPNKQVRVESFLEHYRPARTK